jgi:hypothetical protein
MLVASTGKWLLNFLAPCNLGYSTIIIPYYYTVSRIKKINIKSMYRHCYFFLVKIILNHGGGGGDLIELTGPKTI